ncbi:MAG: type-F conjugative transfer system secretin TraK [Gammaproteobacteria bacterium]|nr:type-F conjugative transfer system secretin TraK [Gammaproteobacteria bacterium]
MLKLKLIKTVVGMLAVTCMAPAMALQVLDAVDHAELTAVVSASHVSRIALVEDRIERVVRGPDGFELEHDPHRGDIYLKPQNRLGREAWEFQEERGHPGVPGIPDPELEKTLFIGTEKGFTYRLKLKVEDRDSAQILIRSSQARSAGAGEAPKDERTGWQSDPRIGELTGLVRAVANRTPISGYSIAKGGWVDTHVNGLSVVEVWRGPRFTAEVVEMAGTELETTDAGGLAERLGARGLSVAAAWIVEPGTGHRGGRLAVIVRMTGAGLSRHAQTME